MGMINFEISKRGGMMEFPIIFPGSYINGAFEHIRDSVIGEIETVNPSKPEQMIIQLKYSSNQVDTAVEAACDVWPIWMKTTIGERILNLKKFKDVLTARQGDFVDVLINEIGRARWDAEQEFEMAMDVFAHMEANAQLILENNISKDKNFGYFREPVGVVGVITSLSQPLYEPIAYIVSAIVAGNSVVFKPSSHACAIAALLSQCFHQAELPPGLCNFIYGQSKIGIRLITHPNVNLIFFNGSHDAAQTVRKNIYSNPEKKFVVQTGGKNSAIVTANADIKKSVDICLRGAFQSSGQRFLNTRRIIVQKSVADQFIEGFVEAACAIKVGSVTSNDDSYYGPLCARELVTQYLRFQQIADRESVETLRWGKEIDNAESGLIVSPGIHLLENQYDPKRYIYRDTVFIGPDVAIFIVDEQEEMLHLADQTNFNLAMSICSEQEADFDYFLKRSTASLVSWNLPSTTFSFMLPLGARNRSGIGPAVGIHSLYACTMEKCFLK